jgi:hypothetical protein
MEGRHCQVTESLCIPTKKKGKSLGITFGDFDMPVVRGDAAELLHRLGGDQIQLIPITPEASTQKFFILSVLARIQCIDESRSTIIRWAPNDGLPDKIGQYRSISKLVLDRNKLGAAPVFRIADWEVALITNQRVKVALEERSIDGVKFQPLTSD